MEIETMKEKDYAAGFAAGIAAAAKACERERAEQLKWVDMPNCVGADNRSFAAYTIETLASKIRLIPNGRAEPTGE